MNTKSSKAKDFVDGKLFNQDGTTRKKVVIFSKTYCGYCAKAKTVFKKYKGTKLPREEYEVIELNRFNDCDAVQDYLGKLTGARTVVIFSKTYCPYCTMAKKEFKDYVGKELPTEEYEVIEIENNPDCDAIQDYLLQITGGRTVPRVFINGKCVGGGTEVKTMNKKHQLLPQLKA